MLVSTQQNRQQCQTIDPCFIYSWPSSRVDCQSGGEKKPFTSVAKRLSTGIKDERLCRFWAGIGFLFFSFFCCCCISLRLFIYFFFRGRECCPCRILKGMVVGFQGNKICGGFVGRLLAFSNTGNHSEVASFNSTRVS